MIFRTTSPLETKIFIKLTVNKHRPHRAHKFMKINWKKGRSEIYTVLEMLHLQIAITKRNE